MLFARPLVDQLRVFAVALGVQHEVEVLRFGWAQTDAHGQILRSGLHRGAMLLRAQGVRPDVVPYFSGWTSLPAAMPLFARPKRSARRRSSAQKAHAPRPAPRPNGVARIAWPT